MSRCRVLGRKATGREWVIWVGGLRAVFYYRALSLNKTTTRNPTSSVQPSRHREITAPSRLVLFKLVTMPHPESKLPKSS